MASDQPLPSSSQLNSLEDPSMMTILLDPLENLHKLSQALFLSLGPPQSKPPAFPPLSQFLECDAALADAVRVAHSHQGKQRRIEELEGEILELDANWRQICIELDLGKRELEAVIKNGDERITAMEKAKQAAIPYPELLTYAQSLSSFTSAPPNMPDMSLPGQPPPPLFFPPFPNEEKMRRGRLNAEAPLGMAGETHSVGRPPTVSPTTMNPAHLAPGANPYRQDYRPAQQPFSLDLDLDLNPEL